MAVKTPDAPSPPDSSAEAGVIKDARRRQRRHRFAWILPAGAAVAAGLFFALGGGGGGSDTHGLTANTEVLRQVEQALAAKPGTIVVQITRFSNSPPNDIPGEPNTTIGEEVIETPAGQGPQNYLYVIGDARILANASEAYGVVNGVAQVYERKPPAVYKRVGQIALHTPNTLYISSVWGPYITKGPKPGTFIYRRPTETLMGTSYPQEEVDGSLPPKPLTLTAAQAHALLDGSDTIVAGPEASNVEAEARALFDPPVTFVAGRAGGSRLAHVLRFPVVNLWRLLKAHDDLRVVGLTTVDGRRAIELAGPKAGTKLKYNAHDIDAGAAIGLKIWVDAKTYAPIKEVSEQILDLTKGRHIYSVRHIYSTQTWIEYKTLPINAADQRLLSPLALHPHAHIDRNYNDYVNATASNGWDPQLGMP